MKTGLVVAAVGVAFGAGILTAVLLTQQPPPAVQTAGGGSSSADPGRQPPRDVRPDQGQGHVPLEAGPGGPAGTTPATTDPGPGAGPGPAGAPPSPPPPVPPPPAPELMREGQRALDEQPGPHGNGKVTSLVYEFDTEEERQAWEENQRAGWAARLQREREIKLKVMREKVGLTPGQEPRLIEIMDREAQERQRLVDALAAKQISRSTFDEQAKANIDQAKAALAALLTPEQLEAYQGLKPREQVLQAETH